MHPLFQKADTLSKAVIGAAIEVHRLKGPGLIESIYEKCLMRELGLQKLQSANQKTVLIEYKGLTFEEPLRFDILVEDCLLLELKCVQSVLPIHKAQLLNNRAYLTQQQRVAIRSAKRVFLPFPFADKMSTPRSRRRLNGD